MDKRKIALIVFNAICVALFVFVIAWSIINWGTVKNLFNGTKLYTQTALDEAYEQGLGDKAMYQKLINNYKDQIETLNKNIKDLTDENTLLKNNEKDYVARIAELEKEVAELKNKIKYYEELLSAYENVSKLIATFMYDDEVYLVQLYESGSKIVIEAPADTEHIKFNGWTVDGQVIDLATYTITENTTFVAKLTYYQFVTYKDGETALKTQKVERGETLTVGSYSAPKKSYYNFTEWQINGARANATLVINEDIDLVAKYEYALNGQYVYYIGILDTRLDGVLTIRDDTTLENAFTRIIGTKSTTIAFTLKNNKINANINGAGDGKRSANIVFSPTLDNANKITTISQSVTAGNEYIDYRYFYNCDDDFSENYISVFVDGKLTKSITKSEIAQKLSANYAETYVPTITIANDDTVTLNFTKVQDTYFIFINNYEDEFDKFTRCYTVAGWSEVPANSGAKTSVTIQFKDASTQTLNNGVKYEYQI